MKEKVSIRTEEKFQAWWNQTFFRADLPYYQLYKQLYFAGADLDYIRFLHWLIETGDALHNVAARYRAEAKKPRRRKRQPEISPAIGEEHRRCATEYAMGYMEQAFDQAEKINPSDPFVSIPLSRPLNPPLLPPPLPPRRLYISARMRQLGAEAAEHALVRLKEFHLEKQERERKRQEEEFKLRAQQHPIAEVFATYFSPPAKYKTGGRGDRDPGGSFFLLAVTEHLGNKRERYLRAIRLLKAIRGRGFASARQDRTNATSRVCKLKNTHQNWKSHLRKVRDQFSIMRTAFQSALPS